METYLSRIEAILNGEDIKPLSRVEELLKEYGGDGYDETYNTDEDKLKNDAFMLHKDTNFIFTDVGKYDSLLYEWDFTKSLSEKKTGIDATLSNATFTEGEGVTINHNKGRISLIPDVGLYQIGRVIEIDIADMDRVSSNEDYLFIMVNDSWGFAYSTMLNRWGVKIYSWLSPSETSSSFDVFKNTTLKIVSYYNKDMEIYANNTLVYKGRPISNPVGSIKYPPYSYPLYIGCANNHSCNSVKITGVRVYKLEEQRNYVWYYNEDKTLVVREKISDGSFRWYFNGINLTANPFINVPTHLKEFDFIKNNVIVGCKKHELTNYNSDCMVGFYSNTVRGWSQGLWSNVTGKVWAIMESTDTGSNQYPDDCYHPWEEPTFDPING